ASPGRFASRGRCVNRGFAARCPRPVSRPQVRDPAPPARGQVRAVRVPRLPRYERGLRRRRPPLAGLWCSPGDTRAASALRSSPPRRGRGGQEFWVSEPPPANVKDAGEGPVSPVPGEPWCGVALFGDPGRTALPGPFTGEPHGPAARSPGGRAARRLLAGLARTAFRLTVYASSSRSPCPTHDSYPAAGQALPGGWATHRVPLKGF